MTQDLYLIIPAGLPAGQVIKHLKFPPDETPQAALYDPAGHSVTEAEQIVRVLQNKGTAVIIKDDLSKMAALHADGVQVAYGKEIKSIKKRIGDAALGVLCSSRDEAMRAGEAGADYIGFDGENADGLTQWWSELFTLPCVDFNAGRPSEAADFRLQVLSC